MFYFNGGAREGVFDIQVGGGGGLLQFYNKKSGSEILKVLFSKNLSILVV